jgi:uncharacterized protein YbcI
MPENEKGSRMREETETSGPVEAPELESTENGDGGSHGPMAAISRAMVKLYKEQFGRGPVKAHSFWCGQDILVCTLEQSLTPAERNLRQMGEHQRLRDTRTYVQYASIREFCEPIELITGRTVRAFVSGIDVVEDVSTETFIFYPRGAEGPSRIRRSPGAGRADVG